MGFPGETEEDFQEMAEWVKEMKFDRLGIFEYSHEENTHAHNSDDDVPAEVKTARAEEIMDIQSTISYEHNQAKIGKEFKVLFDRIEGEHFVGRTEFDSPEVDNEVWVPISEENHVRIGDYATVKINTADYFDLFGSIVK